MEEKNKEHQDTKLPLIFCIIISIFTIITLIIGFISKNPYWIIASIVPAAIYEAIRTEGYYTKAASIGIVILLILEILAIRGILKVNLAQILGQEEAYVGGYFFPLVDILFIFPILAVLCSLTLLWRTYGPYTKWLSVLLIISSVGLLYIVNKDALLIMIKNYI